MRTRAVHIRWFKVAINRDAPIKNEALTFKVSLRILLKVFQDSTLELIHILVPESHHLWHRLFTSNTSSAVEE